jgi:hypothetical protein
MRRALAITVGLAVVSQSVWAAGGNSWSKLRYRGGTVQAKVDPYDYNTTLTVLPDAIVLAFARSVTVRITPGSVTSLTVLNEHESQRRGDPL